MAIKASRMASARSPHADGRLSHPNADRTGLSSIQMRSATLNSSCTVGSRPVATQSIRTRSGRFMALSRRARPTTAKCRTHDGLMSTRRLKWASLRQVTCPTLPGPSLYKTGYPLTLFGLHSMLATSLRSLCDGSRVVVSRPPPARATTQSWTLRGARLPPDSGRLFILADALTLRRRIALHLA
jgi:hypothetical protein